MAITYKEHHEVRLDGKHIGTIKPVGGDAGYAYFPKGGNGSCGDVFPTVAQVKATL